MPRRRRLDVEHLAAAQRAAKVAGASAGLWWKKLSDAAESTTTQQSLDSLFRDAILAMRSALEVDTVAVLLANEAGDQLIARFAIGLSEESTLHLGLHAGQGMAGSVLANRRPLIVKDLSKIEVVTPALRESGLHSIVAVPLLSDERPIGVMYAGSYELDRFNASDVGMLELIADRLTAAIERVRLFEDERAARTEAERLADRLARTQAVTARLVATVTAEEIGAALAETLVEGEPGRGSVWTSVWLLDTGVLVPVSVVAIDWEVPSLAPVPLDADHPIAVAARQTTPAYFDGAEAGARFPAIGQAFPDATLAVIPMMLGSTSLGVFVAAYGAGHRFTTDERQFLEAVVAQVAQALERARLVKTHDQLAQVSAFFAETAKVLAEGVDLTDTLDRLASVALPTLGDICLIDIVSDDGRLVRMTARHRERSRQHLVDGLRTSYAPDPAGPHPAASVIATGQTRWSAQM
ncbi:MAG: GAF domain-containing protein, partial [Acidimicrobiales bacterium]